MRLGRELKKIRVSEPLERAESFLARSDACTLWSLGPWQAWQAWRLSLIFTGYFRAGCWAVPSPPVPEPGPPGKLLGR